MRDDLYECPTCGRKWQLTDFRLHHYGAPRSHAPSDPDVALVVIGGPVCDGVPVPIGAAAKDGNDAFIGPDRDHEGSGF